MRSSILLVLFAARAAAADPVAGRPVALPTEYAEHRFYVTPVTADGVRLRCYTDSGGGGIFLFDDRARTLGLTRTTIGTGDDKQETVAWPQWRAGAAIPASVEQSYWVVPPGKFPLPATDCFLGHNWFGGRVWTFDYPAKTLWSRAAGDVPPHDKAHEAALTFKMDGDKRANQFPRIEAIVDGERIPFLLDTGAMVTLTKSARAILHDEGPALRGGSFITARTFDKWHHKHPAWRVLETADDVGKAQLSMIEVPEVTVGGYTVGPVWFAQRPDGNFDQFMSGMMAAHVEGALGGSALHYLRVTVDYPRAIAVFEQP
jgi:hypothetical protein